MASALKFLICIAIPHLVAGLTGMSHDGKQRRSTAELIRRKKSSRPTMPCDGPRMNPSVDVGNPPRPFRHLRMTERRTPDPSSSRVPVHSALVQKSVTAITNLAGRLSVWMLGKVGWLRKRKHRKRWQAACYQSNAMGNSELAMRIAVPDKDALTNAIRLVSQLG